MTGNSDPKALVRACLLELFGKEVLKRMKGSKTIQKNVLDAINGKISILRIHCFHHLFYELNQLIFEIPVTDFVIENTTVAARTNVKWSWSKLVRVVNEKSNGLRHKSKSPGTELGCEWSVTHILKGKQDVEEIDLQEDEDLSGESGESDDGVAPLKDKNCDREGELASR